ncbi:MAG: flagellar export chaperone FliS [Deltaproteobacteria bacterium]|nr:flagellar export chaperone FliS [Deltaproteobacteria bacterium]
MLNYGNRQYTNIDVTTADQGKLVVLLYEGAIRFLNEAKNCIRNNDVPGKARYLNRVQDIIQELNYSLNTNDGGEIAQNLRSLYLFMDRHLVKAKIERDGAKEIDAVLSSLSSLYDAWRQIVKNPEAKELKETNQTIPGLSRGFTV